MARAILDHIDFLDLNITRLDQEVASRLGLFQSAVAVLEIIPGVGRKVAETIVAETGADMARSRPPPNCARGPEWRQLTMKSAGKQRPAGTRLGASWLRRALIESAKAASRTRDT